MDLITVIKATSKLKQFVEKDLIFHLAAIQLSAAASALSNVEFAKDKRLIYISCINHLEDAEALYKSKIKSAERDEACYHYYYVSALKAIIWKYLEEDDLIIKCCNDCLEVERQRVANDKGSIEAYNPKKLISVIRTVLSKNEFQVQSRRFNSNEFWKVFIGRQTNFSLTVYTNEKWDTNPSDPRDWPDYESSF